MTQTIKDDILRKIEAFIKHARERTMNKAHFVSTRKINGEVCQAKGAFVKNDKYRFQFFVGYDCAFEYNLNDYTQQEILVIFDELKEKMRSKLI